MLLAAATSFAGVDEARLLLEQGQPAAALAEVEALLAADPGDPEARFLKGIILVEEDRGDEAIELFAGLTREHPELAEPYNNLAVLFAARGELEKARQALLAALDVNPGYSTAHENLGDIYVRMARSAYGRALEEDADNSSARLKLSTLNDLFDEQTEREGAESAAAVQNDAAMNGAPAASPEMLPESAEEAVPDSDEGKVSDSADEPVPAH